VTERTNETFCMYLTNTNYTIMMSDRFFLIYYYTIKREINRRLIYESQCRCDERLKATD
jgi:hypothetical protein